MQYFKEKRLVIFLICFLFTLFAVGKSALSVNAESEIKVEYDNIGIGASGAFFEPLINPVNSNNYIVFSDMNGVYWSLDKGASWDRTETTSPFYSGCFSDTGVLFAGGFGVYRSVDNGKTIEMIYPSEENLQIKVTSEDCCDRIYANNYNAEYTVDMESYKDRLYFITVNGLENRNVNLFSCTFDGSDLQLHYSFDLEITQTALELEFDMVVNDNGIYFTDKEQVYFFDFDLEKISVVYSGIGEITDIELIDGYYFILDDQEDYTEILYSRDLISYENLNNYNTLSNEHIMYGNKYYFDWHFKSISGNSLDSIFFTFSSILKTESPVYIGGVLKFNGDEFNWVFDDLNYNYNYFENMVGGFWDFSQLYGICIDPNDENHCIVSSITTVYDLYYGDSMHEAQNLRCKDKIVDDVQYCYNTGLNCQTTYFVREDPFDSEHIIICTTDIGMQISYDGGESFRLIENNGFGGNTYQNNCYDVYFDENTEGLIYGLWSSRHDAPYTPALSDANAEGYFAVSYDGGITWDTSYSTGIPSNSIPVKMSVVSNGGELIIAVATFNNGFYISYDSGRTFKNVNDNMDAYNGMIWGEDVVLADNTMYCLTAYHTISGITPSCLYAVDLETYETTQINLGDIVNARSLTYDSRFGLYINVIPQLYYGWREDIEDSYYYYANGGVYHYDGSQVSKIFTVDSGAFNSAFAKDGTMYVAGRMGTVYVKKINDEDFSVYKSGLFNHLKNICFSNDYKTIYVTTFGGGTYRMPAFQSSEDVILEYNVTFIDWDGSVLSAQTVMAGEDAVLPDNPERQADTEYHYIFSGWNKDITNIQNDMTVEAVYDFEEHTCDILNAKNATCTEDGYTGDMCCSKCGMVVESGSVVEMTGHINGEYMGNGDGTHNVYCTSCEMCLSTEMCTDENGDGHCDICSYILNTEKYIKETSLIDGECYLISGGNYVFDHSLNVFAISMKCDGEYYIPEIDVTEDMLWMYNNGYLYTTYNGENYYLALEKKSIFSYELLVTKDSNCTISWEYKNGNLITTYRIGRWKNMLYMSISDKEAVLSFTSPNNLVLYRKKI